MREELSTAISNRSAAFFDLRDFVSALADAETVITIRRNWSKGHFRKAKALLGLGRFREAAEAVRLGLDFEPNSTVRASYSSSLSLFNWSTLGTYQFPCRYREGRAKDGRKKISCKTNKIGTSNSVHIIAPRFDFLILLHNTPYIPYSCT